MIDKASSLETLKITNSKTILQTNVPWYTKSCCVYIAKKIMLSWASKRVTNKQINYKIILNFHVTVTTFFVRACLSIMLLVQHEIFN